MVSRGETFESARVGIGITDHQLSSRSPDIILYSRLMEDNIIARLRELESLCKSLTGRAATALEKTAGLRVSAATIALVLKIRGPPQAG